MKRYSKLSGVTIVACDEPTAACATQFRSGSVVAIIDEQLQLAGWTIVPVGRGRDRVITHRCPAHKPRGVMDAPSTSGKWNAAATKVEGKPRR